MIEGLESGAREYGNYWNKEGDIEVRRREGQGKGRTLISGESE